MSNRVRLLLVASWGLAIAVVAAGVAVAGSDQSTALWLYLIAVLLAGAGMWLGAGGRRRRPHAIDLRGARIEPGAVLGFGERDEDLDEAAEGRRPAEPVTRGR